MEKLKVEAWLSDTNSYVKSNDAADSGHSDSGYGRGSMCDYDCGRGEGHRKNDGKDAGCGCGWGLRYDYDDDGFGRGNDPFYACGIKSFNGEPVYTINGRSFIITHIRSNVAKGFRLYNDNTLGPCFIVKDQGYFADSETLHEAQRRLQWKIEDGENLDHHEIIREFMKSFQEGKSYPGVEFFNWHGRLTGSSETGRKEFVRYHKLNLNDTFTVDEFLEHVVNNSFGLYTMEALKRRWNQEKNKKKS